MKQRKKKIRCHKITKSCLKIVKGVMRIHLFQENESLSISLEDLILIFINKFLPILKIPKTFVFFLRTPGEYLTRNGLKGSVVKTDPCSYLAKYSPDVLLKTKVLDIF